MRFNFRTSRNLAVPYHTTGPDADAVCQGHLAFKHHVNIDQDILAHRQFTTHVNTGRVGQGGALSHQTVRFLTLHPALKFGKLKTVVNALDFVFAGRLGNGDFHTAISRHGNDVGQVVLTLSITIGELRQPVLQVA